MGKFVIRRTNTGYTFDLRSRNGEVIARSEVYTAKAACMKGIRGIIKCAPAAPIAQPGKEPLPACPRFELFTDRAGEYRFRLRSRNGKVIATSQGYCTRGACENGIESVRANATEKTEVHFEEKTEA